MLDLARFLFQRSHCSPANEAVRPGAFLPKDGATSVFAISDLGEVEIREIGDAVGAARGKSPRGKGEFLHSDVTHVGLHFERDDVPLRHGNLLGWPVDGPELKARQMAIAVALAARALLVLH